MKVYVDELPKDCIGCPCESEYYCNLLKEDIGCCKWGEIHKNCPLQTISNHDKQVRKEVCETIKSNLLDFSHSYWKVFKQNGKQYMTDDDLIDCLNEILDKIQGSEE